MEVLVWILGILLFLRLALPVISLFFLNRALKKNESFNGQVKRINFNLIGSFMCLKEIRLSMVDTASGIDSLKLRCERVDIKVRVSALFRGIVDANVVILNPDVIYANVISKDDHKNKENQTNRELSPLQVSPLKSALEKIFPFAVKLTILNGRIRYIDHTSDSKVDLQVDALKVRMMNFSNIPGYASVPAKIDAMANVFQGKWMFTMTLKPLEQHLTFRLKLSLKEVNMPMLNSFFRSLAKIDVNEGKLSIFIRLVAENGVFNGYIKPILEDLEIIGVEDENDSFMKKIWERLVAIVVHALENDKMDQIATIIPVEGRFDQPKINIFSAVVGVLKNAFIRGLRPSFENSIGFRSIVKSALSDPRTFILKGVRLINGIRSYR